MEQRNRGARLKSHGLADAKRGDLPARNQAEEPLRQAATKQSKTKHDYEKGGEPHTLPLGEML
jgi:hypothetical protein